MRADPTAIGLEATPEGASVSSDRSAATRMRRSPAVPPLVSPPGSTCPVYGSWPMRGLSDPPSTGVGRAEAQGLIRT